MEDTSLRALFEELRRQWMVETSILSKQRDICMHPSYQRIIGLGMQVVPLIIESMKEKPEYWGWALCSITGENPVPEESAGDLKAVAKAWIDWYETSWLDNIGTYDVSWPNGMATLYFPKIAKMAMCPDTALYLIGIEPGGKYRVTVEKVGEAEKGPGVEQYAGISSFEAPCPNCEKEIRFSINEIVTCKNCGGQFVAHSPRVVQLLKQPAA